MNIETRIKLDKFKPRPYQLNLCKQFEKKEKKRFLVIWPRRCLSGESQILLPNGSFAFLKDLSPGDDILSWDGDSFIADRVKHVWRTEVKPTLEVKSFGFLPVVTSRDHRFAYYNKENIDDVWWNKIDNIDDNSRLLNYAGISHGSINDPDLAEFLGYMHGDGYVVGYQQPKFTNTNQEILKRVEFLVKKLFDYDSIWRKKGNGYDLGFSNGTRGGGTFSNKIKELFRQEGKDVPKSRRSLLSRIWEFDEQSVGRFFAGLIAADGSLFIGKRKFITPRNRVVPPPNEIAISCGQCDKYAFEIYWLLRKIGIVPMVPKKERSSNWKIRVSKSNDIKKLLSFGPIYGKEKKQTELLEVVEAFSFKKPINRSCYCSSYKKKEDSDQELYDIETEKHHNFVANGYLVHNSGKDVVAFNLMIRAALRKIGVYYYVFPTYSQARKVIWDSITNDGQKFLDYIPPELVERTNGQEMKVTLANGSLIQLLGSDNVDCYDDKTEILTENGWKLFRDLNGSEEVATLVDGFLEYHLPTKYIEKNYQGVMYKGYSKAIDFMVTPNHRWWVRSGKGFYKFKKMEEISLSGDSVPSKNEWKGLDLPEFSFPKISSSWVCGKGRTCEKKYDCSVRMEDFVALLGIFLAEGSTFKDHKTYKVTISQKKAHVVKKISNLLDRMKISYSFWGGNFAIQDRQLYEYFEQFGKQNARFIPKEIKSLSPKYLKILLEWLVLGDGHIREDGSCVYYSCSKKLIDDVQELYIKLGMSGNISICALPGKTSIINGREVVYKQPLYQCLSRRSNFKRFSSSKKSYVEKVNYSGKIYCVSVPSGIIKVRRNGKELWSGNSIVGTNPQGIIFSEYALQDPTAYQYLRPILVANDGWSLFISTVRGKNHLWEMFNIASGNQESWFVEKLSVLETGHISLHAIEKEKAEGLMSPELVMQEYYNDFSLGVEGAYYAKYLDKARLEGRIGSVPWEPSYKVHIAIDIGVRDSTSLIFFQVVGQTVRLIDYYEKSKEGLEHYVSIINSKPYTYGRYFAPHDIRVREFGSGITRWEKARQLGITFSMVDNIPIPDGIEAARTTLPKCWFDETNCKDLVKALDNYRQEYDARKKIYRTTPLHDKNSHACFTKDTLVLTRTGMRPIIDICDGDEVKTLYGWEKCIGAKSTRKNAKLVQVSFVDGAKISCTPDHLFLTEKGWISAENLSSGMIIQSSFQKSPNVTKETYIGYGAENAICSKHLESDYITLSGKMHSEKDHQIAISTTEITTDSITQSQILNVCQKESIYRFRAPRIKVFLTKLEKRLKCGIRQKQEGSGIESMQIKFEAGKSLKEKCGLALSAKKKLLCSSEKTVAKNFVIPTVRPLMVEGVERLTQKDDVWCINVPIAGHFSLANGAIVHNSDAFRYLAISLPKLRDGMSAKDLQKMRNEALYGTSERQYFYDD